MSPDRRNRHVQDVVQGDQRYVFCIYFVLQNLQVYCSMSVLMCRVLIKAAVLSLWLFVYPFVYLSYALNSKYGTSYISVLWFTIWSKVWPYHQHFVSVTTSTGYPVRQRIEFKLCSLVCKCLHVTAPSYLADMYVYVSLAAGRHHLCSAARCDLTTPWTRLIQYGPFSFAVSGSVYLTVYTWPVTEFWNLL